VKLSKKDPIILTLDDHYSHLRNIPRIALLNCNLWEFPSCSLWRHTMHRR